MTRHKLVFVDVDTQVDFMLPEGKLYAPGAEKLIPNLERLVRFACEQGVAVISSADAHSPDDPEFRRFPPHCVQGTPGQQKLPQTLLPQRMVLPNEKRARPPVEEFFRCQQWILEKQTLDFFSSIHAGWLLAKLPAERYIVYGVTTEYCVKIAALGLLERGLSVEVVVDAICAIEPEAGQVALRQMQEAGASLVKTDDVLAQPMAA